MNNSGYLEKTILNKLISDLAEKYTLEVFEAREVVMNSLAKAYNFTNVSISNRGTITGVTINKKSKFLDLKYYNISRKKYNLFLKNLDDELILKSTSKIEKKFLQLIKSANNILYGKVYELDGPIIKFKLYNKSGHELKNFFADVNRSNLLKKDIQELKKEKGFLLYIPKREKIQEKNGIFSTKAIRNHNEIVRYFVNSIFKDIKETLGKSYGYSKCVINLNEKTITLFLNLYFSKPVQEYFEDSLRELDDFKVIYINKYKKDSK